MSKWKTTPIVHPELTCPLCGGPITAIPNVEGDEKHGVMVWCLNKCIESCHENPFGFSDTTAEAYKILKQKYIPSK